MFDNREFRGHPDKKEAMFYTCNSVNKLELYCNILQSSASLCSDVNSPDNMRHIVDKIPPDKYNKILDIGVANGLETKILKDFGYSPVGIIRGGANIDWALKNFPGITFIDCDMHDLPFIEDSFDAIYCNQVFEHTFSPFIFLLECWCVLREGGLFYMSIPNFEEKHTKNDPSTIYSSWISHHHPSLFPDNVNVQMFDKTGFELLSSIPSGGSFLLKKLPKSALHSSVQRAIKRRNVLASGKGSINDV